MDIYFILVASCIKGEYSEGVAAKKIVADLRAWGTKEIGPIAKPDEIRFGDNLPKTRSGKIMRRLLCVLAKGDEITQDVSTLEIRRSWSS